jgi:heptosyltransferase-2
MSDERTFIVVAPNWLGDAVMALPAIADVARAARVVVAARSSVAPLFAMVPGVDAVIDAAAPDATVVSGATVILLPNSFASAWCMKRAGATERWGYRTDWRGPLLTRAVRPPRRSVHQGEYYQQLVRELGFPSGPLQPALAVPAAAVDAARSLLFGRGWDGLTPLVAMAPGAAYGTAKRWLPAHFAELVVRLADDGVRSVLVGSRGDAETTRWIREHVVRGGPDTVIDLAGITPLDALAGVMTLARACVSNDSGAMHLAAAVGVPLAALFGPTRDKETAPLTTAGGRAEVLINPVWCRPCMLRECPIDHRCMKGLEPSRVHAAVTAMVAR